MEHAGVLVARSLDALWPWLGAVAAATLGAWAAIAIAAAQRQSRHVLTLLEMAEARYSQLLDVSPFGVVRLAGDGAVVEVNARARALLGAAGEDDVTATAVQLLAVPGVRDAVGHAVASGKAALVTGAPAHPHAATALRALILPAGSAGERQVQVLLADAGTDRERARQSRGLAAWSGEVADIGEVIHDINNYLTVICGNAELMLAQRDTRSAGQEEARAIEGASRGARRLVERLGSRLRAVAAPREEIDVNRVVEDVVRLARGMLRDQVSLTVDLERGARPVRIDRHELERVLINLLLNAHDAIEGSGRLAISTREVDLDPESTALPRGCAAGQYVCVAVSDTGTGMTAETVARVFDPFYTTKQRGTGLGLSGVERLIHACGGFVRVESAEGAGSLFEVFLPQVREVAARIGSVSGEHAVSGAGTVLLVEPDTGVRADVARTLARRGYTVLAAGDAAHAAFLGAHATQPIELLVTDLGERSLGMLTEALLQRHGAIRVVPLRRVEARAAPRMAVGGGVVSDRPGISERGLALRVAAEIRRVRAGLDRGDRPR